ncbi:MAG: FAD-dependent oxidoreductase, partial [Anaerolineales bacterium]
MYIKNYDAIIVGGGVMGCATAYYLLEFDSKLKIAIIEKDPSYEFASTPLSDGNMRIQFNVKENIQMSQYGLEVMKSFADEFEVDGIKPDAAFRQQGNLFILDEASKEEAYEGYLLQKSIGCVVEWMTLNDVKRYYQLYN